MREQQDYIRNIAEISAMMERSSKFLSLSGWAGIMAGLYALAGAYIAWHFFGFHPLQAGDSGESRLTGLLVLAAVVLLLALCTAIYFSYKRAAQKGENLWNATTRRMLLSMAVPLVTGGLLLLILLWKGLLALLAPLTLLFYGLALYNASQFTLAEVRILGFTQLLLGLLSALFIDQALLFWALGFGIAHIVYGIYMHFRYER